MNIYQNAIPASVSAAVEALDRKLLDVERKSAEVAGKAERPLEPEQSGDGRTDGKRKGPTPTAQLF